jgi:hypothetical protein
MTAWDGPSLVSKPSKEDAPVQGGSCKLTRSRIVDDDDNELKEEGATGDILVKSPCMVSATKDYHHLSCRPEV